MKSLTEREKEQAVLLAEAKATEEASARLRRALAVEAGGFLAPTGAAMQRDGREITAQASTTASVKSQRGEQAVTGGLLRALSIPRGSLAPDAPDALGVRLRGCAESTQGYAAAQSMAWVSPTKGERRAAVRNDNRSNAEQPLQTSQLIELLEGERMEMRMGYIGG